MLQHITPNFHLVSDAQNASQGLDLSFIEIPIVEIEDSISNKFENISEVSLKDKAVIYRYFSWFGKTTIPLNMSAYAGKSLLNISKELIIPIDSVIKLKDEYDFFISTVSRLKYNQSNNW